MNDRLVSARSVWADHKPNRHTKSFNVNSESHGSLRGKPPVSQKQSTRAYRSCCLYQNGSGGRNNLGCALAASETLLSFSRSTSVPTSSDEHKSTQHTHPALRHRTQMACNSSALIFVVRLGNCCSNGTNQRGNESRASLGLLPRSFPM